MLALSDLDLLALWEVVQGAHPVARPVELLRAADDDPHPEALPIGARDRKLLALREQWFGARYETTSDCPACGTRVELTFDTPPQSDTSAPLRLMHDGRELEYRLPDTRDLIALLDCASIDDARARLAARCLALDSVPDDLVAPLAEALSTADPDGDLRVALTCPECGGAWEALFDPATHLWSEVESAAMRLLRDVDALAVAYGWSEEAILSMSPVRRQAYLRMVTS